MTRHRDHEDDVFAAKMLEVGSWAARNRHALTVAAVLAVIGVASILYYRSYRASLSTQAVNQLEQIQQSMALEDREGAKNELALFLERFGGTPHEGEARLLLGELYLETNAPQQALAVLEPMASSPREPLELQAAALLAAAYEQEARWEDAEATYLRIADRSDLDFQVRDALSAAARIRTNRGDAAGAAELYRRILSELPEDAPDRGLYEMRLAELGQTV